MRKRLRGIIFYFVALLLFAVTAQGQTRRTFSAFSADLGSLGIPDLPRTDTRVQAPCPANAGMPVAQKSFDNLQSMSHVDDKFVVQISELIDRCLPTQSDTAMAQQTLVAEMTQKLQSASRPKKENGAEATLGDLVNVALIARTLVGEIATKSKCQGGGNNAYTKAVGRVILNRAAFAATKKTQGLMNWFDFVDRDRFEGSDPIRAVLFKKQQFSVWNPGDHAQIWAMCPARSPGHEYKDKSGKVIASASIGKFLAWQSAVQVATEMVLARSSFLSESNTVKSLFYTKGEDVHAKWVKNKFEKVVGASIGGTPIQDVDCLELWNPPTSR